MLVAYSKQDFGWVRGRILKVRQDGSVLLKLVDLETLDLVQVAELARLRQLSAELRSLPSPAIIVKLALAPADQELTLVDLEALMEESLTASQAKTFLKVREEQFVWWTVGSQNNGTIGMSLFLPGVSIALLSP